MIRFEKEFNSAQQQKQETQNSVQARSWTKSTEEGVLQLQAWSSKCDKARDEVSMLALALSDPSKQQMWRNVRIEPISGLGNDTALAVEKADVKRGIMTSGAILAVCTNGPMLLMTSGELPLRERAEAMKVFEDLARAAVKQIP